MNLTPYLKNFSSPAFRAAPFALLVSLALAAAPRPAGAAVTQPNGLSVPIVNMDEDNYAVTLAPAGRHVTLPMFFTARGEAINYSTDAHTTPTVFSELAAGPHVIDALPLGKGRGMRKKVIVEPGGTARIGFEFEEP